MKEHFQDYGVRKWAGDDLIELQSEPLVALQALVSPYAPCIISGCAVVQNGASYKIESGLVALRGVDVDGQACVKIVRVEAFDTPTLPVYLSLAYDRISRAYADGSSKTIANNYIAVSSVQASEGALELTVAGGKRLVDTIGVSQKLDRVGGEAKDTVVGFVEAAERAELKTGSKLGVLIGQAKKWFSDLKTLAFKDKVAKIDLEAALATELDNKVAQVAGKGLSTNDFTDALLDKLKNVDDNANNYSLPDATEDKAGGVKLGSDTVQVWPAVSPKTAISRTYPIQKDNDGRLVVNVPWLNTTYSAATQSANGLMASEDKKKLDGIDEGANKYTHPPHTAQSSGLYKITVDSSGHVSAVTKVTKTDITNLGIPGQDTNTTYSAATTSAAGLMSATDKSKLDGIASNANNYSHPTGAGNNHIPSDGAGGQYLKYVSAGTAQWASPWNFKGNIGATLPLEPGMIGNMTAEITGTILVKASTDAQMKSNPVAYVGNTGYATVTIKPVSSSVTCICSSATKSANKTNKAGIWKFTWVSTTAVIVEFISADLYAII